MRLFTKSPLWLAVLLAALMMTALAISSASANAQNPSFQSNDDFDDDAPEPGDKKGKGKKKGKKKKTNKEPVAKEGDLDSDGGNEPSTERTRPDTPPKETAPTEQRNTEQTEPAHADGGVTDKAPPPERQPSDAVPPTPIGNRKTPPPSAPATGTNDSPSSAHVTRSTVKLSTGHNMVWELRTGYGMLGLLGLSFLFFFLHFLLPFSGLRFLGWVGSKSLGIVGFGAIALVAYRFLWLGTAPGQIRYTGLLWAVAIAIGSHLHRRHSLLQSNVHLPGLPLSVFTACMMALVLGGTVNIDTWLLHAQYNTLFSLSQMALYTGFGLLAASAAWLVTSGYLGFLAKSNKGTGYGLEPTEWNDLQLQSGFLAILAYPFFTIATFLFMYWSLQQHASLWVGYSRMPGQWSSLFVWLFLSAFLFSLRLPRKSDAFSGLGTTAPTNKLPSFLLFTAALGGAVLFAAASRITRLIFG